MIDRCLVAAYDAGLEPVLVLTKSDLASPDDLLAQYGALDVPYVVTQQDGTDPARRRAAARPAARPRVGAASGTPASASPRSSTRSCPTPTAPSGSSTSSPAAAATRRPRRSRCRSPSGGWVIDTPGVRSFGLAHVDPQRVIHAFPDLGAGTEDCPRGVHARRARLRSRRLGGRGPRRLRRTDAARLAAPAPAQPCRWRGVAAGRGRPERAERPARRPDDAPRRTCGAAGRAARRPRRGRRPRPRARARRLRRRRRERQLRGAAAARGRGRVVACRARAAARAHVGRARPVGTHRRLRAAGARAAAQRAAPRRGLQAAGVDRARRTGCAAALMHALESWADEHGRHRLCSTPRPAAPPRRSTSGSAGPRRHDPGLRADVVRRAVRQHVLHRACCGRRHA